MPERKFRIRLREDAGSTFSIKDRQHLKNVIPGKTIIVHEDTFERIRDRNWEVVEEIIETSLGERMPVNDRINDEMAAHYEERISELERENWKVKGQLDSALEEIRSLKKELKDPVSLKTSQIITADYRSRVDLVLEEDNVKVLKRIIKRLDQIPKSQRTKTDKEVLKTARTRVEDLENPNPPEKEDETTDVVIEG